MKAYSRVRADIDLSAIEENFDKMHANLLPGTRMAAVIKADGYGHGAAPIGEMLEKKEYIWGYCVAAPEEALSLRHAGLKKPIMLLGYAFPEAHEAMIENDIRACLFTYEDAVVLSENAAKAGKDIKVHIKIDTGMSRIGFPVSEESVQAIKKLLALPHIKAEGIFTHFARADETDPAPAFVQLTIFQTMVEWLMGEGVTFPIVHCSNSAALLRLKEANLSMVRAGISLYGLSPSEEVPHTLLDLRPAMSLIAHISHVKEVPEGTAVSYGGTYVTKRTTRIATIPVGYADGYPRLLSNKGAVLIGGKRAPILGRVCMDQFMVDITEIPGVQKGDQAVLLGRQGDEAITAEEIGALSGRFNYELVCDITKRVPRNYIYGGEIIRQVDYFN